MERANGVLQDRLIKLMRLAGIASWEAGNAFLPAFLVDYNGRFARPAREPEDAHAPACPPERLRDILCLKETRKLSRQLTCQYHQQWLRILPPKGWERRLIGAAVEIRAHLNGPLAICHNSQVLAHELLVARNRPVTPVYYLNGSGRKIEPGGASQICAHKGIHGHKFEGGHFLLAEVGVTSITRWH